MQSKDLTIRQFSTLNVSRALVWHQDGLDSWSPAEWGNALAGEVGELCNVLKKILRHDKGIQQRAVSEQYEASGHQRPALVEAAAKEIADAYTYLDLLEKGVPRELARMILPLSTYSRFFGTVDLHNLMHFIRLRSDSHAQWEIQQYSNALHHLIRPVVPVIADLLSEEIENPF